MGVLLKGVVIFFSQKNITYYCLWQGGLNMASFELKARILRQRQIAQEQYSVEKMSIFIRGFCGDRHHPKPQTMRALGIMRKQHGDQKRNSGEPYIVHPLSMACFAIGLGLNDDNLLATILLHDVCEDTNVSIDELPIGDIVKHGVKYMTITKLPSDKSHQETKRRYFWSLLEDPNALICKALDRYSNLTTMVGVFSEDKIIKNIRETHELLLPVLKAAKETYPELANELFTLRTILRNFNDNLALIYNVELY